jgi:hypothetical protein
MKGNQEFPTANDTARRCRNQRELSTDDTDGTDEEKK